MDVQKYWSDVRSVTDRLPPAEVYYLTSLSTPDGGKAGQVVDIADRRQAAELLVKNSHRLASPEETEQFIAGETRERQKLAAIEMGRKQQFAMPQEIQDLLRVAAENLRPQDKKKEKS